MTTNHSCPECGAPLSQDAPHGLCPACLLRGGKSSSHSGAGDAAPSKERFVAPPVEEIARFFPQLEVIELLGQGGMGAVYKARQKLLDRPVALKILPPSSGQDPAFAERFTREARTMAKLAHPNIVIIFEFGEVEGLYYLIMECVDGVNLRQAIAAKEVSAEHALAVIPQICDALQYAHEEGVVHRDIKPENVLLDKKGRVKIADFGLAKLLGRSPIDITLTASQQIMGTLHYMAPEQIEKPLSVDHRADIYSLGVVFYELLTGELPLGRFRLPSEQAQLDARLDEVVLKTLHREPEQRYQHASEVKTDVETISRDHHHHHSPTARQPMAERATPRRVSLPFSLTSPSKSGVTFGIARFDGRELSLEFEADHEDGHASPLAETSIPVTDIVSIVFQIGLLKHTVFLRTDYLRSTTKLPGVARGKIQLDVDRVDRESAEVFVAAVKRCLAGETPPAANGEDKASQHPSPRPKSNVEQTVDEARQKLVGPAMGLAAAGGLCFLWLVGMALFAFVQIWDGRPDEAIVACLLAAIGAGILVPAVQVVSLRWYGWGIAAVVMGLLPVSPCVVFSAPFAIWMLVVMTQPDVRAAFDYVRAGRAQPRGTLLIELAAVWRQLKEASPFAANAAGVRPSELGDAGRQLRIPAIALMVLGAANLLSLVAIGVAMIIAFVEILDHGRLGRELGECVERTWFLWPSIALGLLMLFGGRAMQKLRSYKMALAGAIAASIPCSLMFVLSVPVGIWAIVALMGPSVKGAFANDRPHDHPSIRPSKPVDLTHAQRRVRRVATGLFVVAGLGFLPSLVFFGCGVFEVFEHFPPPDWNDSGAFQLFFLSIGALAIHLPVITLLMLASWRMRRLKSRGLALAASVVAMLPCHAGFIVGLPIGIWSLAVLSRADIIAAFSQSAGEPESGAAHRGYGDATLS